MSPKIDLAKPGRKIHVGVILLGGITEILDVAPLDLFSGMSGEFTKDIPEEFLPAVVKENALDVEFHWVNEKGDTARLTSGTNVQCTDSFATCPPLDVALMGAHNMVYEPNEAELAYMRKAFGEVTAFLTICGGFIGPMKAGCLVGKTAAIPRTMIPAFAAQAGGATTFVPKRWHQDGHYWSSGALLNGLDMMTNFGKATFGEANPLLGWILGTGHWPSRDVDYKDAGHDM